MPETLTPEPNKKISPSKLMGSTSPALGQVGQGGESKVGKLARVVRTTRVKVNDNTKEIKINTDKLMGVEDEQEQIHETLFGVVEKQGELQQSQKGAPGGEAIENLASNLDTIAKELSQINTLLALQTKTQEANAKKAQQAALREKRAKDEKEKESKGKSKKPGMEFKTPKPVVDFFEKIKNFFSQVLLGSVVLGIIKWFKDPQNKKKINEVLTFIEDNIPIILTGIATILGIGIGFQIIGFLTSLTGAVNLLVGGLKLLAGVLLNPLFLAGVGVVYAASKQGLGKSEKAVIAELESMGGVTDENRKELIQRLKDRIKDMKDRPWAYPFNLTGEETREAEHRIRFLETGNYSYGGETLQFNFGLPVTLNSGGQYDFQTGEVTSPDGGPAGFSLGNDGTPGTPGTPDAPAAPRPQSPGAAAMMSGATPAAPAPSGSDPVQRPKPSSWQDSMFGGDAQSPTSPADMSEGIVNQEALNKVSMSGGVLQNYFTMKNEEDYSLQSAPNLTSPMMTLEMSDIKPTVTPPVLPPPNQGGDTVTILGADGKPKGSNNTAVSSGGQNVAPAFSPYDPNNDTLAPVMAVYNATQ